MRITFTASVESLNKSAYLKALQAAMRDVYIKAARQFLLTAIPRIPIWSGMARGTFLNLEDLVGKVGIDSSSGTGYRIRTTRGGGTKAYYFKRGYYYYPPGGSRVERTPQAGRDFSTQAKDIMQVEGVTLASGRTGFTFKFEVNLTYFDFWDQRSWHAFQDAGEVFAAYVKANLVLPDVRKFLTRRTIRGS